MSSCSSRVQRAHAALADLCLTRDGNQQLQSSEEHRTARQRYWERPSNQTVLRLGGLLQVSSVRHSVDGHVSCVFGHVGVCAMLQQQADDGWVSRCRGLVQDGCAIVGLREHIRPCSTNKSVNINAC